MYYIDIKFQNKQQILSVTYYYRTVDENFCKKGMLQMKPYSN